jgi:O-antigen/teichoic acid export membrane protein
VYTRAYLDAVPVLRLYSVGLVAFVVEITSILFVLGQGPFAARVNAVVLALSVPLSYFGAVHWGLQGAAVGSVAAIYGERVLSLARIARLTGTPVARQQQWSALTGILAAAALAAGAADLALRAVHWPAIATLAAGAAVLGVVYPAALLLTGQRHELAAFVDALRSQNANAAA